MWIGYTAERRPAPSNPTPGRVTAEERVTGLGVPLLVGVHRGRSHAPGVAGFLDLEGHRRSFSRRSPGSLVGLFAREVAFSSGGS